MELPTHVSDCYMNFLPSEGEIDQLSSFVLPTGQENLCVLYWSNGSSLLMHGFLDFQNRVSKASWHRVGVDKTAQILHVVIRLPSTLALVDNML